MTDSVKSQWLDEALNHFSAVTADPDNPDAHYNLAVWLTSAEKWDAAAREFGRALWLNPRHTLAPLGLGTCLLNMDRFEQALEVFTQVAGDSGPACFGKAVALQQLRRFGEAQSAYETFLEFEPNSEETLANLIAMSAQTHHLEHMREYSQKLLSAAPQSAPALQGLATVALERRDHHAAARYCDRIVQLAPDCLEAWHNLRIALDGIVSAFSTKPAGVD